MWGGALFGAYVVNRLCTCDYMHVAMDVQHVSQCSHSRSVVRRWGMRCHGSRHAVPLLSDCFHIGAQNKVINIALEQLHLQIGPRYCMSEMKSFCAVSN